jgi:hypothetical protein
MGTIPTETPPHAEIQFFGNKSCKTSNKIMVTLLQRRNTDALDHPSIRREQFRGSRFHMSYEIQFFGEQLLQDIT